MTPAAMGVSGQNILITGASSGIGLVTARELALAGANVYLAGRSEDRTRAVVEEIRRLTLRPCAHGLPLDLSDLASVRRCAADFLALNLPLHLLINNAGLAGARGLTRDGFEMTFGVNHIGHFVLTDLLLDRIKASAPARILTVASRAHRFAGAINWADLRRSTRSLTGVREYSVSKLCNILFSAELARRLAGSGVSTYALHPGIVDTGIWREMPALLRPLMKLRGMLSLEEGARTTLYCATRCPPSESGLYYAKSRLAVPSNAAQDPTLASELWRRSQEWTA